MHHQLRLASMSLTMAAKGLFAFITVTACTLIACGSPAEPEPPSIWVAWFIGLLGIPDSTPVDGVMTGVTRLNAIPDGYDDGGIAQAIFSDGDSIIYPCVVKVGGERLTHDFTTTFRLDRKLQLPETQRTIDWYFDEPGYGSVDTTLSRAMPIKASSLTYGRSVSRSNGLTFTYSGSGLDSIKLEFTYSPEYTEVILGVTETTTPEVGNLSFTLDDTGSVLLTTDQLSSLDTGRVYLLRLAHQKYDVITTASKRKIGLYSMHASYFPLHIIP